MVIPTQSPVKPGEWEFVGFGQCEAKDDQGDAFRSFLLRGMFAPYGGIQGTMISLEC